MNEIQELIHRQSEAIKNKDIEAATASYADDVWLFDIVGPLQHSGRVAVKTRLTEWFATFDEAATPDFKNIGLRIEVDDNLAFSYGFNHIVAKLKNGQTLDMFWRNTLCWKRIEQDWKIVSAHSSVPFNAENGIAETGLKPDQE